MRAIVTAFAGMALALLLGACSAGKVEPLTDADMALGPPGAKVTVVEYASVSCPVCAEWNNTNWDAFKKKYIDTGRVHYVMREALTHDPIIASSGFLIARCAGKDKYFDVVEALFRQRDAIEASPSPRDNLLAIAKSAGGMNDEQFQSCIGDAKALSAIRARWENYMAKDQINSTPTFVINGKQYVGDISMDQMDQAIAAAEQGKP
jgi:protein-disulfide isomerase